ncbi:hypothetical protein GOV14_00660, partial [Candidatus Pacearchaeota archaeon]|nr:hypothetical protein [Candidatus Pacearchaeota archaeon]
MVNSPKFLRTGAHRRSSLGVRRKKKLKYRKGTGIDNKMRLKMKGHLRKVMIGFRTKKDDRGKINGKNPITINNLQELKEAKEENLVVVAKVSLKNKLKIAEYAKTHKIKIFNLNPEKFLLEAKEKLEEKKKKKKEKEERKSANKKKAQKKAKEQKKKEEEKGKKPEDKKEDKKSEDKKEDKKSEDKKEDKKPEDKKEDK